MRTEVEYCPAKLIVKQIIQEVAKCVECGEGGSSNVNNRFQKAVVPTVPLAYAISIHSLIVQIMYQMFGKADLGETGE